MVVYLNKYWLIDLKVVNYYVVCCVVIFEWSKNSKKKKPGCCILTLNMFSGEGIKGEYGIQVQNKETNELDTYPLLLTIENRSSLKTPATHVRGWDFGG